MGAFSRMRYVIAANMNALIERAEDPEKLLRALIREMEDASEDARLAGADLMAEQQHTERMIERLEDEAAEWSRRAERAVAQERDELARTALKARAEVDAQVRAAQSEHAALGERVKQLEEDMATLKAKLNEARQRLKALQAQDRPPAHAIPEPKLGRHERRLRQAMGRFDRLQAQVDRLEARVKSYEVGGTSPSPWREEAGPADPQIEEELEQMKARLAGKAESATTEDA